MTPTRTFAALLAVAAVACAALGLYRSDDSAHVVESGSITTPLWSPRRVPQPIVDAVGGQRLQAALDVAIGGINACFVVEQGGAALASHAADVPLVPASTEKLLTSVVALAVLGPDSHLVTRAVAAKAPEAGVIDRLWLVGGGDPLLMTPDVQAKRDMIPELRGTPTTSMSTLADAIVAKGVTQVPGGVVGDDSRYETLRYLPTWKDSYRTDGQVGPLGALTVNGGFTVQGQKPVPADDPAVFAASELARLLSERGVVVGRGASRGKAPEGAVEIGSVESPPMREVVGEVITASDNLGAELLTREIGFRASQQGTTTAGIQAITAKLIELGLPTTNLTLLDGSGLDRGNRMTCQLLGATLDLGEQSAYRALWDGLSVAGQKGTLIDQITDPALVGKVRGKTGSLDGVTALVGLVEVGRPLRFAFVANGTFTEVGGIGLRTHIAAIIAGFPDAPPADLLVPRPAESASQPKP
jgi:D-alanyl-D-alanine carboxypeptidase/D-alanyl-D-alanine-endopeptidase (penicillin-binding protein 4)